MHNNRDTPPFYSTVFTAMAAPSYTIKSSSRYRSMSLLVKPDGHVEVRVPKVYDPGAVSMFVRDNIPWIEKRRRILSMPDRPLSHSLQIGNRQVRCTIIFQRNRKKFGIYLTHDGHVEVRVPEEMRSEQVIILIGRYKDEIRRKLEKDCEADKKTRYVTWNGTIIPYTVRTSTRARRIAMHVRLDRSVEVVAPAAATPADIERVISEKAEWIARQVTNNTRPVAVRRKFCDGETYPFLGGTLTIRVMRGASRISCVREGPFIQVRIPDGIPAGLEQDTVRKALEFTMKDETGRAVTPLLPRYATLFGVAVPPFAVRAARRKWGSCIAKNRLTFSSHLCMLPPRLFHYVIAHEVCHLVVMDHSDRYWETFRTVMPDCRERAAELRRDTPLYQVMPV